MKNTQGVARFSYARFLAFYLPQFHPIPENDRWFGKGFTEWSNVVKARPRFLGHYQPRLPGELDYYDLGIDGIREQQADLAREHGIYGFVYYHYWFNGKRVLYKPLDALLKTGKPNFPFCLCWANESWTKKWGPTDGSLPKNKSLGTTLIRQTFSKEDNVLHARFLAKVFSDKRYIRVNGKPLFIIYRPSLYTKDVSFEHFRRELMKAGVGEVYFCMVQSFPEDKVDPKVFRLDAAIEFQPENRLRKRIWLPGEAKNEFLYDYQTTVEKSLASSNPSYKRYPCLMPCWDNTARRKRHATIYINSTPENYGEWVYRLLEKFQPYSKEENFIFINSWNEWAEGSNIEPDEKWGRAYLNAHKKALIRFLKKIKYA